MPETGNLDPSSIGSLEYTGLKKSDSQRCQKCFIRQYIHGHAHNVNKKMSNNTTPQAFGFVIAPPEERAHNKRAGKAHIPRHTRTVDAQYPGMTDCKTGSRK